LGYSERNEWGETGLCFGWISPETQRAELIHLRLHHRSFTPIDAIPAYSQAHIHQFQQNKTAPLVLKIANTLTLPIIGIPPYFQYHTGFFHKCQ
jgi:hypothetical protein